MNLVLVLYLFCIQFKQGYVAVLRKAGITDQKQSLITSLASSSETEGLETDIILPLGYEKDLLKKECLGRKAGLYSHPTNCSMYISCNDGGTNHIKLCESQNHFDPEYRVCVWEQMYPCTGQKSNEISQRVAYCKSKANGVHKDPHRCDSFVICAEEGVYQKKCPEGTLFNSLLGKCGRAEKVDCSANPNGTAIMKYCAGKNRGNYQDPNNCNGYIACTGLSAIPMKCREGLWFDESLNKCDVPTKVHCKLAQPSFSCKGMDAGKYAVKDSCQYFYLCTDNGEAKLKKCPKHKNFQPVYRSCVWTYVYSCDDPNFCKGKQDDKYQNINNCYGYYQCSGGRTFPRNCNPGWRFNGRRCVDASQYICPSVDIRVDVV